VHIVGLALALLVGGGTLLGLAVGAGGAGAFGRH
jgi:hypothetical protein